MFGSVVCKITDRLRIREVDNRRQRSRELSSSPSSIPEFDSSRTHPYNATRLFESLYSYPIQVHVCMFELMFRVDRMLTLVSLAQLCHPKSLLFSCSELSTRLPGRLLAMVYIP